MSRHLSSQGFEVTVANPRRVRLIAESDSKSDGFDAEVLARLGRAAPKLLAPIRHRSESVQRDRILLQVRDGLVRARTQLVDQVRGFAKSLGMRLSGGSVETFARRLRAAERGDLLPGCAVLLATIEQLTAEARRLEREIDRVGAACYPVTRLLRQVPGVGPITSLAFVLTLEDPARFPASRAVGTYLGLRAPATIVIEACGREEAESMPEVRDRWATASAYEDYMGRWSRALAPRFVSWLGIRGGVHWLDVGCGTGALTEAICRHADPASVLGCDPAEPFIEYARSHSQDVRASFVVAGAGALPSRADGYGSVTSLLVLNFLPDSAAALHEMRSRTAAQGAVSACVWDYGGRMELVRCFWDAVAAVDPSARELDQGQRFPLCRPQALTDLFRTAGLGDVCCEAIEIPTEFASFADYWRPLLGGTGSAPSYVASLDADRRAALARKLEETLPRGPGGTIALTARAWAVRGTSR